MRRLFGLLILLAAAIAHGVSPDAHGQDAFEVHGPEISIPHNYESWSLFLVCNPTWLRPDQNEKLLELWLNFNSFGRAIGRDHVAIWFWNSSSPDFENLSEHLDVQRHAFYCQSFGLLPTESPHIVVTLMHPDEAAQMNALPEQHFVASMNGLGVEEAQKLVGTLADGISSGNLDQPDIDSRRFWLGFQYALTSAMADLGQWVECVSFKIDTRFVKLEIIGGNPADDRPECSFS